MDGLFDPPHMPVTNRVYSLDSVPINDMILLGWMFSQGRLKLWCYRVFPLLSSEGPGVDGLLCLYLMFFLSHIQGSGGLHSEDGHWKWPKRQRKFHKLPGFVTLKHWVHWRYQSWWNYSETQGCLNGIFRYVQVLFKLGVIILRNGRLYQTINNCNDNFSTNNPLFSHNI